MEGKKY
jgi:hypothetical protein